MYLDIMYSYSCGSMVKAQPSSGHIFHARSWVRRDYPSEVMEIASYCNVRKVVSQVGVGEIPFHQVISDIYDI